MKGTTLADNDPLIMTKETIRLENHLNHWLGGRVRSLRVRARPGGLVLLGRTHTYHVKQLAQHALMNATDIPLVANDIKVGRD